jgi:hypothetical protein
MKYIIFAVIPILLAGCDFEVYRYPCQDPANWEKAECKKPLCEVSRTCPEHIFDNDKQVTKLLPVEPATGSSAPRVKSEQTETKGECK